MLRMNLTKPWCKMQFPLHVKILVGNSYHEKLYNLEVKLMQRHKTTRLMKRIFNICV